VAAKPTETPVDSPVADRIERGTPGNDRVDEPAADTANVPADTGSGHDTAVEHTGGGAEQQGSIRPAGRNVSRAGARTWHFRRDLHAGHEPSQARHDGL